MLPEQGSSAAGQVDLLFGALVGLATFFLVSVAGLIVYFAVRYRRRQADELPAPVPAPWRLEVAWTLIPLGLALGAFSWAARLYLQMSLPPAEALDVYVVGKQWMWYVQHADGQTEIDELHLPAGTPVRLTLISQDVIHSFYVPAFRVKQDVLPMRYTTLWFQPTRAGRYHLFCAEYCGTDHAVMTGWVYVMTPSDYAAWLASTPPQSPAAKGAQLFQQLGCSGCHRPDALARAPQLTGMFGQAVMLATGETIIADENYIRQSILDPQAQVVAGFEPIMPSYRGQISEEQLLQLVLYVKALAGAQQQEPSLTTPQPAGTGSPTAPAAGTQGVTP